MPLCANFLLPGGDISVQTARPPGCRRDRLCYVDMKDMMVDAIEALYAAVLLLQ